MKLTDDAKELAKQLVEWWDAKLLSQTFDLIEMTAGADRERNFQFGRGADDSLTSFSSLGALQELSRADLIDTKIFPNLKSSSERISVTLLQALREAVASSFEAKDAPSTTVSIGLLNQGVFNVAAGANVQIAAHVSGDVIQNIEQVVNQLESTLGKELLEQFKELNTAIQGLKEINEANSTSKIGKVFKELGNCLQHGANAAVVIPAILKLAQLFMQAA